MTPVWVFRKRFKDYLVQLWRHMRIEPRRRRRVNMYHLRANLHRGLTVKWGLATDAFVKHHTKGEKIAAHIDGFPLRLLRRHVRRCAYCQTGRRKSALRQFSTVHPSYWN